MKAGGANVGMIAFNFLLVVAVFPTSVLAAPPQVRGDPLVANDGFIAQQLDFPVNFPVAPQNRLVDKKFRIF